MDVFEAIADPVRRAVLLRLVEGPARVVDVAADHPISRPAISRHLRVLGEAGLVSAEDRGRERHYSLESEPLAEVTDFVARLSSRGERRPPVSAQALDALDTEVRRTARERRRGARPEERKETA